MGKNGESDSSQPGPLGLTNLQESLRMLTQKSEHKASAYVPSFYFTLSLLVPDSLALKQPLIGSAVALICLPGKVTQTVNPEASESSSAFPWCYNCYDFQRVIITGFEGIKRWLGEFLAF